MFSEASVILFTWVEGGRKRPLGSDPPLDRDSWTDPLERTWDQIGSDVIHPPPPPVLTSSGDHCSGRYASYWNAFFLGLMLFVCMSYFFGKLPEQIMIKIPGIIESLVNQTKMLFASFCN